MVEALGLIVVGMLVAAFVGYNIGGSSTGVAFGPAVGSRIVGKVLAGGLFTVFAFAGGWTVGRNVVETMGGEIVPAGQFSLEASVAILFFTGFSLLISNLYGVPASTSMTAVGSIAGLGLASDTLNERVMFTVVSAWIIAPVVAFWIGAVIGRYLYPYLDARFAFNRIEGDLLVLDRSGPIPKLSIGENVTARDMSGALLVLAIACYMGFSAGASNVANAVAPLVGSGVLTIGQGVLLAIGAIGLGAVTIARRTLDTVGDGLTDLPILAALIVSLVSATIITILSQLGIPASLAVSATMCIVGLGWGRASRTVSLATIATGRVGSEEPSSLSVGALATESEGVEPGPTVETLAAGETSERRTRSNDRPQVPKIGEERPEELAATDLFNPVATARVMVLWVLTPTLSVVGSYLLFEFVPLASS